MADVKAFLLEYAKLVASRPDELDIQEEFIDENFSQITIKAQKSDAGRLIGKNGNMVVALRTIIAGCGVRTNKNYKLMIVANEGKS